jgi:methionyl-tRNA formyltransferase
MAKRTVLFLGSKPIGYHCFHFLLQQQSVLDIEVIGLLSNNNTRFDANLNLKTLAAEYAVPVFEGPDAMPEADFIYSVQYHQILKAEHIAKARINAFNLHMAPLPEYRGCNQFSFAIIDGKKEFGTTIHRMDTRIDHGDILFEKRFPIPEHCWVETLYELTETASIELFQASLAKLVQGNYTATTQASLEAERGTSLHYRNEINTIKEIDLNWEAEKIARHIRATSMKGFEPPYALLLGEKVYFTRTW